MRTPINHKLKINIRLKSIFIDFKDFKEYLGNNNDDIKEDDYNYIFTIYGNKNIKFNNSIRARLYFKQYYLSYLEVYKKELELYKLDLLEYLKVKEDNEFKMYNTDNSEEIESDYEVNSGFLSGKTINERIVKDSLINNFDKINKILKNRKDPKINFYENIVRKMESTYQNYDYNMIGDTNGSNY